MHGAINSIVILYIVIINILNSIFNIILEYKLYKLIFSFDLMLLIKFLINLYILIVIYIRSIIYNSLAIIKYIIPNNIPLIAFILSITPSNKPILIFSIITTKKGIKLPINVRDNINILVYIIIGYIMLLNVFNL